MKINTSFYKNLIVFVIGVAITLIIGLLLISYFFSQVHYNNPKIGLSLTYPSTMHIFVNDNGPLLTWDEKRNYSPKIPSQIQIFTDSSSIEEKLKSENYRLTAFKFPQLKKVDSMKWDNYYRSDFYDNGDNQGTTIVLRVNKMNYTVYFTYDPKSPKSHINDFENIIDSLQTQKVN
jgi:hypothetical protein